VKRQQREEVEEASEEELRAVEDEKISAAAFDDIEGFQDDADAGQSKKQHDASSASWQTQERQHERACWPLPCYGKHAAEHS
jgi:hypothetical protein